MEIIKRKKFAKTALDKHIKAYVMHVTFLLTMVIYPVRKAQIVLLVAKKVRILFEYSDFSDVFLKKKDSVLLAAANLN